MPQITPYEASVNPNGEIQTKQANGSEDGAAKGLQELGQGVEQLGTGLKTFQSRHEVTLGSSQFADAKTGGELVVNNLKQSFNPEEPGAIDDRLKDYDESVNNIKDGLQSPEAIEYITKKAETYRPALVEALLKRNAKLAGQENKAAIQTFSAASSSSAYNNPDLLGPNLDQIDSFIKPLHGGDGEKEQIRNQMTRSITMAAAQGAIAQGVKDGDLSQVEKEIAPGGKYNNEVLGETDVKTLNETLNRGWNAIDRDAKINEKRVEVSEKKQQLKNFQDIHAQIDSGTMDQKTLDNHFNQGRISASQWEVGSNRLQNIMDGTMQGDIHAFMDANRRLSLPDSDSEKIRDFEQLTSEYGLGKGRGLTKDNLDTLAGIYLKPEGASDAQSEMWDKVMTQAQKTLIKPTYIPWGDRDGMSQYGKALTAMHNTYTQKMQSGQYTPEQLLSPDSKDYVGNVVSAFQRSKGSVTSASAPVVYGPNQTSQQDPQQVPTGIPNSPPLAPQKQGAQQQTKPAVSPKQQAALDAILSRFPKKGS